MPDSIPYLLLRYGRLKTHLYPLSSFWGVAQFEFDKSGKVLGARNANGILIERLEPK